MIQKSRNNMLAYLVAFPVSDIQYFKTDRMPYQKPGQNVRWFILDIMELCHRHFFGHMQFGRYLGPGGAHVQQNSFLMSFLEKTCGEVDRKGGAPEFMLIAKTGDHIAFQKRP